MRHTQVCRISSRNEKIRKKKFKYMRQRHEQYETRQKARQVRDDTHDLLYIFLFPLCHREKWRLR